MTIELFPVAILAGGLATRLRPITESFPKSLLEFNGEPFIDHQLKLLSQQGIHNIVVCIGYKGELIQKHINDRYPHLNIQYVFDGSNLLGTGGAIKNAIPLLGEHFFVMYGDSYLTCDFISIQKAFIKSKQLGLMTVFKNHGLWDKSNIHYEQNEILAYDKNSQSENMHYIDYGIGILSATALNQISIKQFDLALLYQTLLQKKQLAAFEVFQRFYEIGSFAGIQDFEYYLQQQKYS